MKARVIDVLPDNIVKAIFISNHKLLWPNNFYFQFNSSTEEIKAGFEWKISSIGKYDGKFIDLENIISLEL